MVRAPMLIPIDLMAIILPLLLPLLVRSQTATPITLIIIMIPRSNYRQFVRTTKCLLKVVHQRRKRHISKTISGVVLYINSLSFVSPAHTPFNSII